MVQHRTSASIVHFFQRTLTQSTHQFANMLEELFRAVVKELIKPDALTEQMLELKALKKASGRATTAKAAGEIGLIEEMLKTYAG